MSRTSISRYVRLGMLLMARGWTSSTPVVATVSGPPSVRAAASTASASLAAGSRASRRSGISTAPAWPPEPSYVTRKAAGAAMAVTAPIGQSCLLQQRPLLDVQLHERVKVAARQAHVSQRPFACRPAGETRRTRCHRHPQVVPPRRPSGGRTSAGCPGSRRRSASAPRR